MVNVRTPWPSSFNENPHSMFLIKNKKIGIPLHTLVFFFYITVGFKGYAFHGHAFLCDMALRSVNGTKTSIQVVIPFIGSEESHSTY